MKQFLIIGSLNAVIFKDVIPSVKRGEVWFGHNKRHDFTLPDGTIKNINTRWLTNIGKNNRKPLQLTEHYSPEKYPRYDNYEAIEVGKVKNIPLDFDGVMGVPLTFLDKNDERFEVITIAYSGAWKNDTETLKKLDFNPNVKVLAFLKGEAVLNGKTLFTRVMIRRKR